VTQTVAVIGCGRMGAAMAARVAGAGHQLTVWNRTRTKAESIGVTVADTPHEAVADADVVIVSLADDQALRDAYSGPDGIVAGLSAGQVVADTSTVSPHTIRALAADVAATGAVLIDTPVSGSVPTVQAGQILVMAGGDPDAVERARPALESFAQRIILLGPVGSGATMKLAVNAMVFGLNQTLSEALVLAEKAGIARETAYEVIANSAVAAPYVAYKRAAFLDPASTPVAFALDLVAKDLDLAAALAAQVGASVPQLATNHQVVADAVAAGRGPEDLSAVAEHLRRGN
jgi:3-hydroxyisobutyrate dehydrogenase-like beta-hydroxyacid dehydrogenase